MKHPSIRTPAAAFGLLLLALSHAAYVAADPAPSITSSAVRSAIVSAVERDRVRFGGRQPLPGVLIGVWDRSGHAFTRAFGYADLATKRPLSIDDHFRIGSNTKTFVVSVLLQLIAEKKLGLDDPLRRFTLGVNVPNARNITVRELCNMRSGLFEAFSTPQFERLQMKVPANFDSRMLIRWAVQQKPYFAPGKGYHYSNTNYLLLGLIIESVTNDSVGNQIRKRLLQPFGLAHTSYPQTETMPEPWARGYELDAQRNWADVSNTVPVRFMGSAGEMISDMADVRRWIVLYATGRTGGPSGYRPISECNSFSGIPRLV
ncbi:MAG: serine hydrolase domain-containing protein [Candidatus Tumulicola sp.]